MRTTTLTAVLLALACGGARSPDTAAWDAEVAQGRQQVLDYQGAVATTSSTGECTAQRDRYAGNLRPILSRMRDMSGGFDDCFAAMGRMGDADVGTMCAAMDLELNRYASAGCGSPDAETNRSDGLEHCVRMLDAFDRATSRSGTMTGMMSGRMGSACGTGR